MKMLLKIIVVVIAIVSVAAVIALFTRDKYTLARTIVVSKPVPVVFDFIKFNRNQRSYSKWLSLDPHTSIDFKGAPDGTPGAIMTFASNDHKAGTGEWEITKVDEDKRIDFELRFLKPFAFTANGEFKTQSLANNQTQVTWTYHSGMNWPMNLMLLFLDMDKLVGKDIQTSLENLKFQLEKP